MAAALKMKTAVSVVCTALYFSTHSKYTHDLSVKPYFKALAQKVATPLNFHRPPSTRRSSATGGPCRPVHRVVYKYL